MNNHMDPNNFRWVSCELIINSSFSHIYNEVQIYIKELDIYNNEYVNKFIPVDDIRTQLLAGKTNDMICPNTTIESIFVDSTRTYNNMNRTLLSYSNKHGYMEPLFIMKV